MYGQGYFGSFYYGEVGFFKNFVSKVSLFIHTKRAYISKNSLLITSVRNFLSKISLLAHTKKISYAPKYDRQGNTYDEKYTDQGTVYEDTY